METMPTPEEARAALADAESSATRLAADLRLPSYFHSSIGAAISFQIATSALGITIKEAWAASLFLSGLGLFVVVAAVQLVRFRRRNGAWVWALADKVVLGSGTTASVTYCLGFAAAIMAALVEVWWVVPLAALAGGIGYTVGGQRWLRAYRADPVAHTRRAGINWITLAAVLATVGLVVLVAGR